jgi:hypothetical protein
VEITTEDYIPFQTVLLLFLLFLKYCIFFSNQKKINFNFITIARKKIKKPKMPILKLCFQLFTSVSLLFAQQIPS